MALKISSGRVTRANSVLLYGVEGIGKTTLCANLPGAFIIDTEGGSAFIDCARAEVENLDDLSEAFRHIATERKAGRFPYQIVILDTVDKIWQWCADKVIADTDRAKSIEDIPYGKGYAQASEKFIRVVFDSFLQRIKQLGIHVVACAHSKVTRISPPDAPEYTQYQVKITAPNKQAEEAANLLRQGCDAVLFAHFQTTVKTDGKGGTGKAVAERRVLSTTHSAQWEAKNRVGLPEEVEMTPEAIASLFPELRHNDAATARNDAANAAVKAGNAAANAAVPAPAETQRGMDTPPASGADPRELGGYARHHGLDTRTAPAPAELEEPTHYTLPDSFKGLELALCYYLQSKGKLTSQQTHVEDIPQPVMKVICKNEAKILAIVQRYKQEKAPF